MKGLSTLGKLKGLQKKWFRHFNFKACKHSPSGAKDRHDDISHEDGAWTRI